MKKYILLFVTLLFSLEGFTQINFGLIDGGKGVYFRQKPVGVKYVDVDFEETLLKRNVSGKIYVNEKSKGFDFTNGNYNLEYQLLTILIKKKEVILNPSRVYGFEFVDENENIIYRFVSIPLKGKKVFFEILVDDRVSLLLYQAVSQKNDLTNPSLGISKNDKLVMDSNLYLYLEQELIYIKSRKSLLKHLANNDMVASYVKEKKLDVKNINEMVEFVKYYNSIE